MPRYSRNYRRKTYAPRRRRYVPKQAIRTVVRNMAETKVKRFVGNTYVDDSWHAIGLFNIAQGDGHNERIGNKIWVKGVRVRSQTFVPTLSHGVHQVRFTCAMNKDGTDQANFPSTILETVDSVNNNVIRDHIRKVSWDGVSKLNQSELIEKYWIPVNKNLIYDGAAVNDITDNYHLIIALLAEVPNAGADNTKPNYSYEYDIFYKDI